jgi:hypothetical protein
MAPIQSVKKRGKSTVKSQSMGTNTFVPFLACSVEPCPTDYVYGRAKH